MLTFKPFTTLLNITLNKPTLCVKTSQICWCWCWALCCKPFCCLSMRDYVEPYAVNRLCLSMRNVRDYHPLKDYRPVATLSMHSLWLSGGLVPPCFRHTASSFVKYVIWLWSRHILSRWPTFSATTRFALRKKLLLVGVLMMINWQQNNLDLLDQMYPIMGTKRFLQRGGNPTSEDFRRIGTK